MNNYNKITKHVVLWALCLLFHSIVFSQETFDVRVIDYSGRPVSNIQVSFSDHHTQVCWVKNTNSEGRVSFDVQQVPLLVYLHDTRPNPAYGVTSYFVNQSLGEHRIIIPYYPKTQDEAGKQLDKILENVAKAHGYYSAGSFSNKVLSGATTLGQGGLMGGVPGVFSISPVPQRDNRGRWVLVVSGVLAEALKGFVQYTNKMITGQDYNYIIDIDGSSGF